MKLDSAFLCFLNLLLSGCCLRSNSVAPAPLSHLYPAGLIPGDDETIDFM